MRLIYGADRTGAGEVRTDGRLTLRQPLDAAIGLVPESREDHGPILGTSIAIKWRMARPTR